MAREQTGLGFEEGLDRSLFCGVCLNLALALSVKYALHTMRLLFRLLHCLCAAFIAFFR